jgi:hypothetical protein
LLGCLGPPALRPPAALRDYGFHGGDGREVRVLAFEDGRSPPDSCTKPAGPRLQPVPGSKAMEVRESGQPAGAPARRPLICRSDAPRWFDRRLALALKNAGFRIVGQGPLTRDALEVQGTLQRLEIEFLGQSVIADSWVRLDVRDGRGLSAHRSFYAQERTPDWQGALDKSAQRAVRDMLAAVLSLSNRYPASAGAAAPPTATP